MPDKQDLIVKERSRFLAEYDKLYSHLKNEGKKKKSIYFKFKVLSTFYRVKSKWFDSKV